MSLFDDILRQTGSSKPTGPITDPLAGATSTSGPIIITADSAPMITTREDREPVPPVDIIQPSATSQTINDASSIIMASGDNLVSPVIVDAVSSIVTPSYSPIVDQSENNNEGAIAKDPDGLGILDIATPLVDENEVSLIQDTPVAPTFGTTDDLIAKEISDINIFLAGLDTADAAKLAEKDAYRDQKKHFSELEIQAEKAHQKMLEEREHAEKMKAYLEQEQAGKIGKKKSKATKSENIALGTSPINNDLLEVATNDELYTIAA